MGWFSKGEKLSKIRQETPNPLGKRVSFRPDECGDNLGATANNIIFEKGAREHGLAVEKAKKEINGHGARCGCDRCKVAAKVELEDSLDQNNWLYQQGRWDVKVSIANALEDNQKKKNLNPLRGNGGEGDPGIDTSDPLGPYGVIA